MSFYIPRSILNYRALNKLIKPKNIPNKINAKPKANYSILPNPQNSMVRNTAFRNISPFLTSIRGFSTIHDPKSFSDEQSKGNNYTEIFTKKIGEIVFSALKNDLELQEYVKQANELAKQKVGGGNSNFNVNYFNDPNKLDNLLKEFMSRITKNQGVTGYCDKVDRYFKTSVTIEVLEKDSNKVVGGMDLVSSNGKGTPIVALPTKITYGDGNTYTFTKGLKNDESFFKLFKEKYLSDSNPAWGEGRLFYSKPKHLTDLMLQGKLAIIKKEWSGAFALATRGSKMSKVLESYGFEPAKPGDSKAIDTIEFTGGKIPSINDNGKEDGEVFIPKYEEVYIENGESKTREKTYQVYFLRKETVEKLFKTNDDPSLNIDLTSTEIIHA